MNVFQARRMRLLKALERPLLLFSGGTQPRNYPQNPYPFRADSNFLYFFERPEPNSAAFFDPGAGTVTLYLPERTLDDALWHGELESFAAAQARHAVDEVLKVEQLEEDIRARTQGRQVDSLAVPDAKTTARAAALTGLDLQLDDPARAGPAQVVALVAQARLRKAPEELEQMQLTAQVTREAHLLAMAHSRVGVTEQFLAGQVDGAFARAGCVPAYGTILSVRGEVLHTHSHRLTLADGDIVLLDAGAEAASGYCSDVTRCWPVSGSFSPEGAEVYELVLASQVAAIAAVKPGVRYLELHRLASRVIAEGLVAMGVLEGSPDALVESGAHALFFPHGLGHQIGLDVHDLETFGDQVHYPNGRTRSLQFGTKFLRMDMDLEEGMTFTIEPGVYFVPAILRSPQFRQQFRGQVRFDKAERFLELNGGRGFGGIRIEDDVVCTAKGAQVLTDSIPKGRAQVEERVRQGAG